MKLQWLHLLLALSIFSCKSPTPQRELPVVLINDDEEHVDMGLSELLDDFEIIPLETNENGLVGSAPTCLVLEDYLIVANYAGGKTLLQFDRTGKFLKELGNTGMGPNENGGPLCGLGFTQDGKNLIANFTMAQGFNVFDLENGNFQYSIHSPSPFILGPLNQISDSLFFISGQMAGVPQDKVDSTRITFINKEGKIVSSISRKLYPTESSNVQNPFGRVTPYRYQNKWRVYFEGGDTIFQLEEKKLFPIAVLTAGEKELDLNRKITNFSATDKIRLSLIDETSTNWFMRKHNVSGIRETSYRGETSFLLDNGPVEILKIDKKTLHPIVIHLTDDIFSMLPESTLDLINIRWQDDGVFYFIVQAIDVLNLLEKVDHSNLTPKASKEIEKLKDLKEDDNPVVFVFKVKGAE